MRILTFDIEDWFHILDNGNTKKSKNWRQYDPRIRKNTERILDTLDEVKQKGTFFCLGWVAKKYPSLIKQIYDAGHEIGTHSYFHQLVYELSIKQFDKDLNISIDILQNIIGEKVRYFRAPGFSITSKNVWAFEVLAKHGIEIDCSVFPAPRTHGGFAAYGDAGPSIISISGNRIKELPINLHYVANIPVIYSGGGYFRLMPIDLINYWCRKDKYVMTYFHPRDFDPEQPRISKLSRWRNFKSYVGLKNSHSKFKKLLSGFDFQSVGSANQQINWEIVKIISFDPIRHKKWTKSFNQPI